MDEVRATRNAYYKQWRKDNPEKCKRYQESRNRQGDRLALREHLDALRVSPGERFGRLTVIAAAGLVKRGEWNRSVSLCRCDCGTEIKVMDNSLRTGNTKSCGCLKRETVSHGRVPAIGEAFAWLTVIGQGAKRSRHRYMTVRCKCGTVKDVLAKNLVNGTLVSCGCKPRGMSAPALTSDKVRAQVAIENAKRRGALGSHTEAEWVAVVARQGGRCAGCLEIRPLVRDHIRPVADGGGNEIANIQGLCRPCNAKKWRHSNEHFLRKHFGRLI